MHSLLQNKKVLVTAGPTWVPVDSVRVISNISSGLTGIVIAQYAARNGAYVTLFLGPALFENSEPLTPPARHSSPLPGRANSKLKIVRFTYFDELQRLIRQELKKHKYDIVIHAAAVSDYKPDRLIKTKIESGRRRLTIFLKPTAKIINAVRRYAPKAFLVMFKLEVGKSKGLLIKKAYESMLCSKADLVVANNLDEIFKDRHRAYIIDSNKSTIEVRTKKELADRLFKAISERL